MDWDDLKYLLTLSRFGTIAKAARELQVNYTTVSRRLDLLQEKVGTRLLEKVGRQYRLTDAGQQAARVAEQMEQHIQGLERQWVGQDTRLVGSIRVATIDILASMYAEALADFCSLYPGVELEVTVENSFVNLTRRQADVAIRVTTSPPEHLIGRRIAHFHYSLYGARSLLERYPKDTPLENYPWLAWDERLGARVTRSWMKRNVPNAHIAARVDNTLVLLSLTRSGTGLAFMPDQTAAMYPELQHVAPATDDFHTDVWLLTHEELRNAARIRAVMDHMANAKLSNTP